VVNVPIRRHVRHPVRADFIGKSPATFKLRVPIPGEDLNDLRNSGGRISVLAKPTDALSIRLTALAQDIRSDVGPAFDADPVSLQPASVDPISGEPLSGFTRNSSKRFPMSSTRSIASSMPRSIGISVFADLTSVTSYGETILREYSDTSFERTDLGLNIGDLTSLLVRGVCRRSRSARHHEKSSRWTMRSFSQELRLASPDSDRLVMDDRRLLHARSPAPSSSNFFRSISRHFSSSTRP
jgi:hypothetical protein